MPEEGGLIAFDLQEKIAAFFHHDPCEFCLAVQRVGRHKLVVQSRQFFQQLHRGGLLAAFGAFFPIVDRDGQGRTVVMMSQGEQADVVANHFAIQSQSLGQRAGAALATIGSGVRRRPPGPCA